MNARFRRLLQGFPCAVDIGNSRSAESRDGTAPHKLRNFSHRFEVAVRRDREPRFDDIYLQSFKLTRHSDFFFKVHTASRRLLSVAQGRVENVDFVAHKNLFFS